LITVFDVNFLQAGATAPLQALASNLVAYLAAPIPVGNPPASVPTLSEWAMILLACGLALVACRSLAARKRLSATGRE
jgi:hypothetical protein